MSGYSSLRGQCIGFIVNHLKKRERGDGFFGLPLTSTLPFFGVNLPRSFTHNTPLPYPLRSPLYGEFFGVRKGDDGEKNRWKRIFWGKKQDFIRKNGFVGWKKNRIREIRKKRIWKKRKKRIRVYIFITLEKILHVNLKLSSFILKTIRFKKDASHLKFVGI